MPLLTIKTVFDLGADVYVKTDATQVRGIITAIEKEWNGGVRYRVKFCDDAIYYQAIELTSDKDAINTTSRPDEDDD